MRAPTSLYSHKCNTYLYISYIQNLQKLTKKLQTHEEIKHCFNHWVSNQKNKCLNINILNQDLHNHEIKVLDSSS